MRLGTESMPYSLASSGLLILTKAIPCYQNKVMERLDNKDIAIFLVFLFFHLHLGVAFVVNVLQFGYGRARFTVVLIVYIQQKKETKTKC